MEFEAWMFEWWIWILRSIVAVENMFAGEKQFLRTNHYARSCLFRKTDNSTLQLAYLTKLLLFACLQKAHVFVHLQHIAKFSTFCMTFIERTFEAFSASTVSSSGFWELGRKIFLKFTDAVILFNVFDLLCRAKRNLKTAHLLK